MTPTDLYHDAGHARLRQLLETHEQAAEVVKTAELEHSIQEVPPMAFAWREKSAYPIHSREHAVISGLYAFADPQTPAPVLAKIAEALDMYGVDLETVKPQAEKTAALTEANCLFPEQQAYPVRDAHEVKLAEKHLLANLHKLGAVSRAFAFSRLADAAEVHGVKLATESYRRAGRTNVDREFLADQLDARAAAASKTEYGSKYAEMAVSVRRDRKFTRDPALVAKLAERIADMDKHASLTRHYDRKLHDPLKSVYGGTKVASEHDIQLGTCTVDSNTLAQMPPSFFADALGPDIVREIAPSGVVDPQAVKAVVETLPMDEKLRFQKQLSAAGVACAEA